MPSSLLILLVGEQPAPNLLPTRHLNPEMALLVHTHQTQRIAEHLRQLLEPTPDCRLCSVDPYRIDAIQEALNACLTETLSHHDFMFNLTGGTKPMALAAFRIAQSRRSPFVYFQTEGNRSLLYRYAFRGDQIALESSLELPATISLDDYLRMYVGSYTTEPPRTDLEREVVDILRSTPGIDEVLTSVRPQGLAAVEVDFVVRCGDQVGVGEVKTKGAKAGIDQLNAVAEPRYLGTYIRKFLISGEPVDPNNKDLARAYRVEIVELSGGAPDGGNREKIGQALLRGLKAS